MFRLLPFLFFLCLPLAAEEADSPFLLRNWRSEDGLPGNIARSVGQTADGYLWIATAEGLARFDGIEFETIPATGEWRGRPLDFFRIFTPHDGSLWVATYRHGLFRLGAEGLDCVIADFEGADTGVVTGLFTHREMTYFERGERLWRVTDRHEEAVETPDPDLARAIEDFRSRQQARGRSPLPGPAETLREEDGSVWSIEGTRLLHREADASPPPRP